MHPYPGNRVAIGRAVVCYAWDDREFSEGIKCRHCIMSNTLLNIKPSNDEAYFVQGSRTQRLLKTI